MVEGWRDKTPDSFGFSLKVPQVITHEKVLLKCGPPAGGVLQFGYFNKKVFAD
jgi:uncharacterized protein YecE (DUF72 family)